MEQTRDESGATRSQHVVHVMPRDNDAAADIVSLAIERIEALPGQLRVLVIVPTSDDAIAIAAVVNARGREEDAPPLFLPVTSAKRAARLLSTGPHAVAGTPADLLSLLAGSTLKVADLQGVILLWVDELTGPEAQPALETLLAEMPKDAERVATTATVDEALEQFLQRHMWRARRIAHAAGPESASVAARYVAVAPANRGGAVRSLLDGFDPPRTVIVALTEESEAQLRHTLRTLGYAMDATGVEIVRNPSAAPADLVVFFDEPESIDQLQAGQALSKNLVVLVAPSRVARFRALAGGEAASLQFTGAFQSARSAEDVLRDELRGVLRGGSISSQVLQLEPLSTEYDAVEIAAAALFLLQRERHRGRRAADSAPVVAPVRAEAHPALPVSGPFTRVFLNIGERDGARAGDVVGAVTGEAGIFGGQIGKVDLRETHAVVEIASEVAPLVIERLTGTTIRGRRVVAREDRERGASSRGFTDDGRGERRSTAARKVPNESREGPREGGRDRAHGGPRGGARADRRGDRDPTRGRSGAPRGPARGGRGAGDAQSVDRVPRAAREADEWATRGDRLRHSKRGGRREP